jgi:pSer/pThr/pTyr-binding forkhead associated (FHA) protein
MRIWRKKKQEDAAPAKRARFSLEAVEGADTGSVFQIQEGTWVLGRGTGAVDTSGAVRLKEASVSTSQARLICRFDGLEIEHREGATNPTLVNGSPISRSPLRNGDRLRAGMAELVVIDAEATQRAPAADATIRVLAPLDSEATMAIGSPVETPRLVVASGPAEIVGSSHPLGGDRVTIGRSSDCAIQVPDVEVSRLHAEVCRVGDGWQVQHHSKTNPTLVNGRPVTEPTRLSPGDEIELAKGIRLNFIMPGTAPPILTSEQTQLHQRSGLQDAMEARMELDQRIESQFMRSSTFLDIDVVGSFRMKAQETRSERIFVSFERFRSFVENVVLDHQGKVLNSNGDEVMAYFDSADHAVQAGTAMIGGLDEFNARKNAMSTPFHVRVGIHAGRAAIDTERGVAYSTVLDGAGHLQKEAPVDALLISEETLRQLTDPDAFAKSDSLDRDGLGAYVLVPGAAVEAEAASEPAPPRAPASDAPDLE